MMEGRGFIYFSIITWESGDKKEWLGLITMSTETHFKLRDTAVYKHFGLYL